MSNRSSKPDTEADIELKKALDSRELPAFTMTAGAGSGKTTSLVKALAHVARTRGPLLRSRGQRVACITYTEVAAQEIFTDLGEDPLARVSTVHSFLWSIISPFQSNIAAWVRSTLEERRDKARSPSDRDKFEASISRLDGVQKFRYGFGPDLGQGVLGHEDVIKASTALLLEKPLLTRILARRYPVVFVDESQDTFPEVVSALKHVRTSMKGQFCLGFFGDPMQKIYVRGIGTIEPGVDWTRIAKLENFRSPRRVLDVMNAIRSAGDGLQQVSGREESELREGLVYYFALPADENRTTNLQIVRQYLDEQTDTGLWTTDNHVEGAKILVIAHRMAARRLGFGNLYAAFHDSGSRSLSQSFDEGTAWPLRFLIDRALPLVEGSTGLQMRELREASPLFARLRDRGSDARTALREMRAALAEVRSIHSKGGSGSVGTLLTAMHHSHLIEPDARLTAYVDGSMSSSENLSESTIRALDSLFACDVRELDGYGIYLSEESPYSTQQGVKGAEFNRVVVVLDDDEGRHNQFSYEKLLGLTAPSDVDKKNAVEGKETTFERTRRLLYVCVSRSTEALAVVLYSDDPGRAASALRELGLSSSEAIMTITPDGILVPA